MFLDDFFSPFKPDDFLPPEDLKSPYDDVTVPVADVVCRCHGFSAVAIVPVVAGIHLDASFPALTAISAVADDQCHAVASFLSLLRSPLLLSSLLLLVSLLLLTKLLLLASLLLLPCCCLHP
jgi:hypothetical protein